MSAVLRPPLAPIGWSIALHAAIAGLLLVGITLPQSDVPQPVQLIEAVIADQAVLQAVASQRREDDRRRDVDLQRRQRETELQRQQEDAALMQREEQTRVAEAEREAQAAADARRKTEAQAKRKAEQLAQAENARLKAEREADLRARLAQEEQRTGAAFQGLKARYVALIQAHVERRWFKPPGIRAGASCSVLLTQIPGGEVVGVRFGACDGGEAMRQSIETAIQNASPLPPPPEPALFEREVRLVFTPEE